MIKKAPIALALDAPDLATMKHWVVATNTYLSCMKVGLETFLHSGREATDLVREYSEGCDLFLDLKLHDIPQTVANAARAIKDVKPEFLTVHAAGGPAMISAAAEALPETKIVAVTVLTSLDESDLAPFGVSDIKHLTRELAKRSVAAGARALVCSPHEVAEIRDAVGKEVILITPGVRPSDSNLGDQKRVMTPTDALKAGSDLLVIGRPITESKNPGESARKIAESLTNIV